MKLLQKGICLHHTLSESNHCFIMCGIMKVFWFSNCFLVLTYTWWPSFFFSRVLNNIGFGCGRPSFAAVCCDADTGKSLKRVWLPPLPCAQDVLFSFAPFFKFHRIRTVCYFLHLCTSLSICDDMLLVFHSHCAPLLQSYSWVFPIHSWMLW